MFQEEERAFVLKAVNSIPVTTSTINNMVIKRELLDRHGSDLFDYNTEHPPIKIEPEYEEENYEEDAEMTTYHVLDPDGTVLQIVEREIRAEEIEPQDIGSIFGNNSGSDLEEGEIRLTSNRGMRTNQYNPVTMFKCTQCPRQFSQRGNLLRHIQTHSGIKPFVCNLCGHRFTQKSNLQKHLDTHNGDKRFECGVCHKAFVQKTNLLRHLKVHTGEKPFKCELCGHRFTQKGNLKKHMQLHTSNTESVCDYCSCKFPSYTAKMRHETSIHRENFADNEDQEEHVENKCSECPATFRTKRALFKHKRYHE